MTGKPILFGDFEFPRTSGLVYLLNEEQHVTDYLFVNDPREKFSMYFEKGFPIFEVPENSERSYCLFEVKKSGRRIKFFCPEKHANLNTVVWYFYVELFDTNGVAHGLPGQVRLDANDPYVRMMKGKPPFIEILETVQLNENYA